MKESWVGGLESWFVRASTASDVAVVMALFFGHLDGKEQAAGGLVLTMLWQRQLPHRVLEA
jgi:hypothetical protein